MGSSGKNLSVELGPGFTLLAFGVADADAQSFTEAAAAARVPLRVLRDTFADGREAYGQHLILVRPDQYVAWTGNNAPPETAAVLAKVTGRE